MSEKIIYESDISQDEKLIADLRQKINEWAGNIPHHDLNNLGDLVEVESLCYKPTYSIKLLTQFEWRDKGKDFKPYENESIPKLKYKKLNDFDSWDIDTMPEVDQFISNDKKYLVMGSQRVKQCHTCSGRGLLTCPACNGNKQITCSGCEGRGKNTCSRCRGKGKEDCRTCGGSGTTSQSCPAFKTTYDMEGNRVQDTCPKCNGSGYVRVSCNYCRGGRVTCSNCSGRGTLRCEKCKGSGKITCARCKGRGEITCRTCKGKTELLHYFYIHRILDYTEHSSRVLHEDVYDQFPEYKEMCQNYESENIYLDNQESITEEDVPDFNHLNDFISRFIKDARKDAEKWDHQHFQELSISRIDTWELKYRFNNKDYVMLFTGSDYEVVPGISPISEVSYKHWNNAVSATRKFNYLKTYETLSKAAAMNVYEMKEKVDEAKEEILYKIKGAYYFGSFAGVLLSVFLGGFLAFTYFSEVNLVMNYVGFINRETNFFYAYHAWSQTAFFMFLCINGVDYTMGVFAKFKKFIPGALLRALAAFVLTLIFSLLTLVVLALLNATGITLVITFVGAIIYWVFTAIFWLAKVVFGFLYSIFLGILGLF